MQRWASDWKIIIKFGRDVDHRDGLHNVDVGCLLADFILGLQDVFWAADVVAYSS